MDLQKGQGARSRRWKVYRGKGPCGGRVCAGFVGSILAVLGASQSAQAQAQATAQQGGGQQASASGWAPSSVDSLLRQTPASVSQPAGAIGSFQLLSSLAASAMYNSNLSASPGAEKEGLYYTLRPELRAVSQWNQHRLELFAGGDGRVYQDYASDNQANFYTGGSGEIDIYHDLQVLMQARYSLRHEERGTGETLSNYKNPIQVETVNSIMSVNKEFNRLWFQFGGEIQSDSYSNGILLTDGGATPVDQAFRSGQMYRVVNRTGYEVSGKTSLFIESACDWHKYEDPTYNSEGYRVLGGVKYGLTTFLRGELAAGWMHEGFNAIGRANLDTYTYRTQVLWEPTPLLNVALVGNRELAGPSEYYGGSSRLNTEAGVRTQYALKADVQLNVGAGYEWFDYIDKYKQDTLFRYQGSVIYQWRKYLAFSLTYVHEAYAGGDNISGVDYGRDSIIAGVAAQY